ncbi:biotin--[acetyl-CoA-carboxylase] ligase [Mediterraneibacter glycyrrhizinilyticus]|uniref:biotin--[acetyl-CoA-carboxylase] ligase n=1 Tax=Mediterraneibacter glycyrrhizinilyticus TaxID=342942 RepID=UPI001D06B337|nr:biotin--[acetyl-CoA-carboxylase] ligase [Mediterraneibacter glycyrrhizinilyticus]MCB6307921.1 biotin--[acetyl-CoA-carboxylase] ligase [Lachnospiraceae bacterium 210521-DFI.1.109]MCB6425730.1 biotin--[acetyl-CoA-carboxylase] ligase [Mediterraneibacter glycyrrhizinilyticus]
MKAEILKMLKEADDHISGQQLCEQFQVSRTAVWKVINQLKEEGYQVEAVRNKGYRIIESPDVLTREELSVQIGDATRWAGQEIVCFTETDSTNVRARKLGENGAAHGTLVVAEQQTAGRGRRGRGWESPAGSSIYMSLLLRPEFLPNKAPMLTIVMAYSVATALREQTGLDFRIKWPNDIVLNGKKVVGILTEMSTEIEYINHVVIGVGINVNTEAFPEEICATATSIRRESGKTWRRAELIAAILRQFEVQYERFVKEEDLAYLREAYDAILVNCNREVRILGEKDGYRAVALGIDDQGELLVRKEDGTVTSVYAGEVSVRGIYGYV